MSAVFHRLDDQPIMRNRLDRLLADARASRPCRHDAALVASELFTNAIEHGGAAEVCVAAEVDDRITIVVSHPSSNTEPVRGNRDMPPPSSGRGRGLAIVNRLAIEVRTEVVGGRHRTAAVLALRE